MILLTGSLVFNDLRSVDSAVLDGPYSVAEGVTGVTSASSIQMFVSKYRYVSLLFERMRSDG